MTNARISRLLTGSRFFPFWLLLCCGAALQSGCGAVGEPLPPLRNIPERTRDLSARQVEDHLDIEWTWPMLTTEGEPLKKLARFEVYAMEIAGPEEVPSLDVFEKESHELLVLEEAALASYSPGEKMKQTVPAGPLRGKIWALAVRGESTRGREAGFSNLFAIEVADPPEKTRGVEARVEPDGIVLAWAPAKGADAYQILRASAPEGPFQEIGRAEAAPFRDSAIQWNGQYSYRVRGVSKTRTGEIEGPASDAAGAAPRDRFPPGRPRGLRAVVGLRSVELVWDYNSEPDVAGYRVRRGESGENLAPLAAGLLQAANYTDSDVQADRTYFYSVSAADKDGNESEPSETVAVTLP